MASKLSSSVQLSSTNENEWGKQSSRFREVRLPLAEKHAWFTLKLTGGGHTNTGTKKQTCLCFLLSDICNYT